MNTEHKKVNEFLMFDDYVQNYTYLNPIISFKTYEHIDEHVDNMYP